MRYQRALGVLPVVFFCMGAAAAEIIEIRTVGNKTVYCMHTGLFSNLNDCGVRADSYTYVFVGSISAIAPSEKDEKEIQITPQEIFHGEPATPLTVRTSQALCLPKLAVGDRWLFFLRKETGKPIVLDYYGNDSRPVADAQTQIETLRRLKNIGDFAIVRGNVMRGLPSEGKSVPGARVVAHRASDNLQFFTTTGSDGRYEFQPLPPGKYTLIVDPIGSLQPDKSSIEVSRGACWDVRLSWSPQGQLGGHVRRSDGSPAPHVPVIIMGADGSWFTTQESDASGYFHTGWLLPGKYVVGINLRGAPAWKYPSAAGPGVAPPASLYYPGTRKRSGASVINLAIDEKRDNIDFIVPKQ